MTRIADPASTTSNASSGCRLLAYGETDPSLAARPEVRQTTPRHLSRAEHAG